LSAGQDIQKDAEGKAHPVQVVNLLVTPEQAQVVDLASNQTKIQLVLRNPLDTKTDEVAGAAQISLFKSVKAPVTKVHTAKVAAPKAPPAFSIEVLNGNKSSEEKFSTPGGQQ
jgi:pilus assembly protein CpaB